ncbi:MAG: serine/threonine protein kinase [Planctomycetota bacterium]|nr:MAG: serine/threonine protein kinase [Planctomycetota bacterium]
MTELSCPGDAELLVLVTSDRSGPEVEQHVLACAKCSLRVERLRGEIGLIRRLNLSEDAKSTKPATPFRNRFRLRHGRHLPASIGRYHIVAELAEGGQGVVYRAIAPHLAREVVIKLMKHEKGNASARQRLVDEGRMLAELRHPNLVTVHDLDFHEGRPFLVLDYVRGIDLRRFSENGFDRRDIANKLAKVARALDAAHRRGIVHFDLKPQNIVVNEDGEPILIDFGLARLADAWSGPDNPVSGGTPHYMAPEQARAFLDADPNAVRQVGPAADIFGLGAVLYHLLCGEAPFAAEDSRTAADRASESKWDETALRRSGAPRQLAAICRRAMQSEPAARYRSAGEMADALERYASSSNRRLWLAAASLLLIVGVGSVAVSRHFSTSPAGTTVNPRASFLVAKWRPGEPGAGQSGGTYARFTDLVDAVPIANNDLLRVEAKLPRDLPQVAVFVYSADRGVEQIREQALVIREGEMTRLRVPKSDATRFRLQSPPGLCLIIVCARRSKQINVSEMMPALSNVPQWPVLPEDDTCVAFDSRQTWLPNSRGAEFSEAPEKPIIDRIETVRQELSKRFSFLHGVAFQHE